MTDPTGDPSGARPRPAHNAMVASAARIKLSERRFRHIRPQDWQREAWHYFDVIGEIYFATTYLANHLAKMRLYPAMVPDDPRDVPTPDSSEEGKAALTALRGTAGGYSEILREAALNLQVAGEGFLVGLSRATTLDEADFARIPPSGAELPINEAQEWDIKSTDELDISTDGTYTLRDYPNAPRISLDDSNAFVTRIWTRHPRYCVDEETEILTTEGWKKHEELRGDEKVLILNHQTGVSEWQCIQAINRFPVTDEPMLSLESHSHSSLTTMSHRWPVMDRDRERAWRTSATLQQLDTLIGAAPNADIPAEPKYSDDFVELMAWFWTEGSIAGDGHPATKDALIGGLDEWRQTIRESRARAGLSLRALGEMGWPGSPDPIQRAADFQRRAAGAHDAKTRNRIADILGLEDQLEEFFESRQTCQQVTISQSEKANPGYVARIRRCLQSLYGPGLTERVTNGKPPQTPAWRETLEPNRPLVAFALNHLASEPLLRHAPNRVVSLDFIRELTRSQLELFIQTSLDGDRSAHNSIGQAAPERLPAFELAGILAGYNPRSSFTVSTGHPMWYVRLLRKNKGVNQSVDRRYRKALNYSGIVWCPTTPNGTWLARRNGKVYFTGNSALATSPMRGILASAEEIERIERAIRAAAKSRAAGPGLLLLPDEMSFGSVDPTRHASAENADDDPFQAEMIEAMTTAVRDEGSAAALVPILVRGPAEMLKEVRKLSLAIDIDEKLLTLDRAITRLAQGLNIPPEIITGKAELSHWVAWQVSEEVFSAHVEPLAVPIVDALTIGYYRIFLEASGMSTAEASRRMLWYDPTAIITRPNRSADADFGLEHIALSERGWRKAKNIPEEDAPTDLERLMRLVMQRGSFDPVFTSVLLKLLGLTDETITEVINQPPSPQPPRTEPAETLGPPPAVRPRRAGPPRQAATLTAAAPEPDTSDSDRPPEPEPTSTAATFARNFVIVASSSPDGSEMGLRLYDIDHDISTRLHAASSAALTRAMDRATSVIISKFRDDPQFGAVIAGMHDRRREIPSRIGIVAMQTNDLTTDDLLRDAFAPLHAQFIIWATRAYARAIRVLGLSSDESPDDLAVSQTVTEAADWLVSALSALAAARLFDPSPTPEPFGEIDDSSDVPFGIVREALARAGGAAPAGIYISTAGDPMGGIATGALLLGAFSRIGGGVEGWQWVYGETVRSREFPPHHDLDGVRFSSWTDDALSNRQTWPAVSHYVPGDHAGCYCAAAPVILPPQEAVA